MNECKHDKWEYRRITQNRKDGKTAYFRTAQCLDCGTRVKFSEREIWLPNQGDEAELKEFDRDFERSVKSEHYQKYMEERALKLRKKYHEYEVYINKSDDWKKVRAKVLKRACHVCESCLEKPAIQVHHTNYESLFNEVAYELRAVCVECHRRIHEIRFAPPQPFD